jgi:hypothetical protein
LATLRDIYWDSSTNTLYICCFLRSFRIITNSSLIQDDQHPIRAFR